MYPSRSAIPYERQQERRSCGAAALTMVYRSLGLACTQADIWRRVARLGPGGVARTDTRLLAADALSRGLVALTIEARSPWAFLQECGRQGVRLLLNHRLATGTEAGHYTILVGVEATAVSLHDPYLGPERRLDKDEFLALWEAGPAWSEITGGVLVAIDGPSAPDHACHFCDRPIPLSLPCGWCGLQVPLRPAAILECVQPCCPARTWARVFCPGCDGDLLC